MRKRAGGPLPAATLPHPDGVIATTFLTGGTADPAPGNRRETRDGYGIAVPVAEAPGRIAADPLDPEHAVLVGGAGAHARAAARRVPGAGGHAGRGGPLATLGRRAARSPQPRGLARGGRARVLLADRARAAARRRELLGQGRPVRGSPPPARWARAAARHGLPGLRQLAARGTGLGTGRGGGVGDSERVGPARAEGARGHRGVARRSREARAAELPRGERAAPPPP